MNSDLARRTILCTFVAGALIGSCALAAPSTHTDSTSTAERSWHPPSLLEASRGNVFDHEISFDANGNAIAVWSQSEGVRKAVWTRRFEADAGWGKARRLSAKYQNATTPQIAMNKRGDALIVWYSSGIWASRFSPSLEWTRPEQVHETDSLLEKVALSIDDGGNSAVVWQGLNRTGYNQIYARRHTVGQGWETTQSEEGRVHELAFTTPDSLITVLDHQPDNSDLLARPYSLSTGWGKPTNPEWHYENGEPFAFHPPRVVVPRIVTNGSDDTIALWEFEGGLWVQHYHEKTGWDAPRKLADDGRQPDIDINANGHAVVVWNQRGGADGQINAVYYEPEAGWSEPTAIEFERGSGRQPLVRLDQGGNAVALWYETDDAGKHSIWSNRYTPDDGWHTAGAIAVIPSPGPYKSPQPLLDLAVSDDGEAIASWRADGKYHANLWVAHWTIDSEPRLSRAPVQPTQPASGAWQTAILVEDRTTPAFSPSVAQNPDGRTIAVWRQEDAIWASHRLPGEPWQPAQRIGDEADRASRPQVAINANGRATAAWTTDFDSNLLAAHYTPGSGWQPAETIQASDRGLDHENLQLAVTPAGATVLAWDQSPDVKPPEVSNILEFLVSRNPDEIHGVWASIYRDDEGWSQPESLPTNDTRGIPTTPKLGVASNGNAVIAWKQVNDDRDAIWATHYRADRHWLARLMGDWTTSQRIGQHDSRRAEIQDLAVNEDGEAIALWENDSQLWVNHYSPNEGWQTAQAIPADPKGYSSGIHPAAVAFGPDGTAMAVWPKHYTADRRIGHTASEALWAARYMPESGWQEAEFLWTYNQGEFRDLDLTLDQHGNALLVWQQNGPPPYSPMDAGGTHTIALRYDAIGGWGTPQYIGPKITGTADSLVLDGDQHGNAVAVWTKGESLWSNDFTTSDTATTESSEEHTGELDESFQQEGLSLANPRMAASENGDVFVLWAPPRDREHRIWTIRHDPAAGWGTPYAIGACDDCGYSIKPSIATDAQGNAMAVWQRDNAFWARYYHSGQGWKPVFRLSSPDDGKSTFSPQLAMHPDGQVLVVWAETTKDNLTDLRARRFLPAQGWQPAERLENNDHDSYYSDVKSPRVAFAANGNAFAVWQQGDPQRSSIWANRYDADKGWQGPELVETQNHKQATRPQLAVDAHGNALVTWEQDTGFWSNHYRAGQGWQQPRLIPATDKAPRRPPRITLDNRGNVMLIWRQDGALRAMTSLLGGTWSSPQRVAHNEDDTRDEHVIYTDRSALVAWDQRGLWARRYIPGQGWEKPRKMDWGQNARVAITETNALIIVWRTNNRFHLRRWPEPAGN